ncbi:lipase member H-like [Anopheles bellator]|uniref:lipase member H-like n=1 Tax=Anopheles bellator TaxID=139047 RepID=UPI002647A728|nr:lipase member H-like [Anopheles bellator]
MKRLSLLALVGGLLVSGHPAAVDLCRDDRHVLVPRDTESVECLTDREVQDLKRSATVRRFDAQTQTRFLLWTQQKPTPEELKIGDPGSLANSTFDPRNPTRFLIHGWLSDWTSDTVHGLALAYTAKGAFNVIGIDWSAGASSLVYLAARFMVNDVADAVARQVSVLLAVGQKPSQIVLIGHSLGAHIAGLTGKRFRNELELAAVVALDPAGPLFFTDQPEERVDRSDARYVEVIHTNTGMLGHREALGQADFYPNGGSVQPGCSTTRCSHKRAVDYFRKSLESARPLYVARRCETNLVSAACAGTVGIMGGDPIDRFKVKSQGLFFLTIGDSGVDNVDDQ